MNAVAGFPVRSCLLKGRHAACLIAATAHEESGKDVLPLASTFLECWLTLEAQVVGRLCDKISAR